MRYFRLVNCKFSLTCLKRSSHKECMGLEIVFNSFKIHGVINTFATHFHTKVQDEGVEQKIYIPSKYGACEITALDLKDG